MNQHALNLSLSKAIGNGVGNSLKVILGSVQIKNKMTTSKKIRVGLQTFF